MSDCASIRKLLPRDLADPSDDVRRHLAECGACRERRQSLEASFARFAALPRTEPSPSVWAAIEDNLAREAVRPRPRRSWAWVVPAWGLAAAALVVIVLLASSPRHLRVVEGVARVDGRTLQPGDVIRDGAVVESGRVVIESGAFRVVVSGRARVGEAWELFDGQCELETRGAPVEMRTPEGPYVVRSRAILERGDAVHVDVRTDDVWITLSREAAPVAVPRREYDAFVAKRDRAREMGRRYGELRARCLDCGRKERLAEWLRFATAARSLGDSRLSAELVASRAIAELRLDETKAGALRDEIARTVELGVSREGLPPGWFVIELEDVASPVDRSKAAVLKEEMAARLAGVLDRRQDDQLYTILLNDDEEEGENEDEDDED